MVFEQASLIEHYFSQLWHPPLPEHAIVVGGGRWGRIICSVLSNVFPSNRKIAIVSYKNFNATDAWAEDFNRRHRGTATVEVVAEIPDFPRSRRPAVAIVANTVLDHYATARDLIELGYHTLVEKPFVLGSSEAQDLVDRAASVKLRLCVGLVYRFASYLHDFRDRVLGPHSDITKFRLCWSDPKDEIRHGIAKQRDLTISVVQDVFAHAWSIQQTLFPGQTCKVESVRIARGGLTAHLEVSVGSTTGILSLSRADTRRRRTLEATTADRTSSLDFTSEPGTPCVKGAVTLPDPLWQRFSSPLRLELGSFFAAVAQPKRNCEILASDCIGMVRETERAQAWYAEAQETYIRNALLGASAEQPPQEVLYAIAENLAPTAARLGQYDLRDETEVERVTIAVFWALRRRLRAPITSGNDRNGDNAAGSSDTSIASIENLLSEAPLARRLLSTDVSRQPLV